MDTDTRRVPAAGVVKKERKMAEFAREELNSLGRALNILEPFRELRRDMPLQYVYTFLLVARNPGKTVMEYAKMAGVSQSVMSRHLLDIGPRNRNMEQGFGLVEYAPSPMDLRVHYY